MQANVNHIALVRARAAELGIEGKITKSKTRGRKYTIELPSGKRINFGAYGMSDYLIHNDPQRRSRFRARARGIKDAAGRLSYKNPESGLYYSYNLLW